MNYCFFTPTYIGDIERVKILRDSIRHFVKESLPHYLIVPKEDSKLFIKAFKSDKDVIITQQNNYIHKCFYPSSFYRLLNNLAPSQSWRLGYQAGRPGWIIQQIVKLSLPDIISEEAAFIIDSDVFFIRHLSTHEIVNNSVTDRFLIRLHPSEESALQRQHITKSREILGLGPGLTDFHYMSWPTIFYKDWVISLQTYLSEKYSCHWQKVLFNQNVISEYSIYGIFVDEVARFANCNIISKPVFKGIWNESDFTSFLTGSMHYEPEIACLVVQSNLGIPTERYRMHYESFLVKKPLTYSHEV